MPANSRWDLIQGFKGLNRRLGGPHGLSGSFGKEKEHLPLPGIEQRFFKQKYVKSSRSEICQFLITFTKK
jgi:hypothetical protein